jgi:acyl-CoA synthetase (AMP-forming)/AMP-acid ligase II
MLHHSNLETTHRKTMACCYKFSGLGFLMLGILLQQNDLARRLTVYTRAGFFATPEPTHVVCDASVGTLLPNVEAKILNNTGSLLQQNQRRNVYIRTPFVMKGYLGEPIQMAETVGQDGWIRTGNIGWINDDDQLYIVGRSKV